MAAVAYRVADALFSIGGVIASLVGSLTLSWGWSAATTPGGMALVGVAAAALVAPAPPRRAAAVPFQAVPDTSPTR